MASPLITTLEQPFADVKSQLNTQLPLFADSMIHHKVQGPCGERIVYYKGNGKGMVYGVSSAQRVLSPQLLLKKFDLVCEVLKHLLGMPPRQRDAILGMLRYWAYYGSVYCKQAQISEDESISKATFWRAVRSLRDLGLIRVINRFIIRPHAQISNLYRFDKLLILIARYLAEHGVAFWEKWLKPYLQLPGSVFWRQFLTLTDRERPSQGLPLSALLS